MPHIPIEQALFAQDGEPLSRSPGFADAWLGAARRLVVGFGRLRPGLHCPLAVFARPLAPDRVAVVQVSDSTGQGLRFHFLVVSRSAYDLLLGDPFALARQFPANWTDQGSMPSLFWTLEAPARRTVDEVRRVLQRIKAFALREGEDPLTVDRTIENSESPALLGGAQVLVDGGKLVFERPAPDPDLVEGLWTLLPHSTRARLWPATFAFSNDLAFDVVVLPHVPLPFTEGYTIEDQAAEYPEGRYELALQSAAESGDQEELDRLFGRRSSRETLKLAAILLIVFSLIVFLLPRDDGPLEEPPKVLTSTERIERLSTAAAAVGVGHPWTTWAIIAEGNRRFLPAP